MYEHKPVPDALLSPASLVVHDKTLYSIVKAKSLVINANHMHESDVEPGSGCKSNINVSTEEQLSVHSTLREMLISTDNKESTSNASPHPSHHA